MSSISSERSRQAALDGSRAALWRGAALTALAAIAFPRLNAVLYDHQAIWQVDREAAVLIPVVVAATLLVFALVGRAAWRRPRLAPTALVTGVLSLAGVAVFFLSTPIVLGGLALTLGNEARLRAEGRGALAATALGALGVVAGAAIWLAGV